MDKKGITSTENLKFMYIKRRNNFLEGQNKLINKGVLQNKKQGGIVNVDRLSAKMNKDDCEYIVREMVIDIS